MGEPVVRRSMRLNQEEQFRGVSPRDVQMKFSQGHMTLSPHTCRKLLDKEDLCRTVSGWYVGQHLASPGATLSQGLTPRIDHGSTHQPTLNTAKPGKPVSGGLTQRCLNEGQSMGPDAAPSHMSKTGHGVPTGPRRLRHLWVIGRC